MDHLIRQLIEKAEQAQRELSPEQRETLLWRGYDTVWGFLQSSPDLYARASLTEHLDNLLATALLTIPSYSKEHAETADVKTTSPKEHTGASAAPSGTASGSSVGASSRDPSFQESDLDDGQR